MGDFHILVVEDEAISAFALEDLLTSHGYRVTVALNGLAGLEAMERDPADAILTDLRMPKLDGKEMIRRLTERGEEEKNKLKAIVREQLQQLLSELDVATKEDIRRLEQRIENLNQRSE